MKKFAVAFVAIVISTVAVSRIESSTHGELRSSTGTLRLTSSYDDNRGDSINFFMYDKANKHEVYIRLSKQEAEQLRTMLDEAIKYEHTKRIIHNISTPMKFEKKQ